MHLSIILRSQKAMELPIHYNHIIQAMIYNVIEPDLAKFLHEKGYESEKRKFKLFTYSRINGKFQIKPSTGMIRFDETIELTVSSPVDYFCQSIANGILTRGTIRLGKNDVTVEKIMVKKFSVEKQSINLTTLSPVVAYSTLIRPDGRKYTCYFQPGEPDFESILENNLKKKYQACFRKEAPLEHIKVKKIGMVKQNIVKYKDIIIKGYTGRLTLSGPHELLQMGVEAGLGSKNSQGFGCVIPE